MITNFEDYTKPINAKEILCVAYIVKVLNKNRKKSFLSDELVLLVNKNKKKIGLPDKYVFRSVTLRKCSNYIRSKSIAPLIATTEGYKITYRKGEIKSQIASLNDRSRAITNSAKGLLKFL